MALDPSIAYVGVNDHDIDLFEGMFEVPEGMAYNSYVIHDEACAVVDSVDARFTDQWFANLDAALEGPSHASPNATLTPLSWATSMPS